MASIRKYERNNGTTYQITVITGTDSKGKQIRHYKTWRPPDNLKGRQLQKEVQKVAADFEKMIELGYDIDNNQTFSEYADYVLKLKERSGTKVRTIDIYRDQLRRINPAIGHLKLTEIRPQHLNSFYANLAEEGVRDTVPKAVCKIDLAPLLKKRKITRPLLSKLSGVNIDTIDNAVHKKSISLPKAEAICKALKLKLEETFNINRDNRPLSNKTILEHHRLIRLILAQAEKEMLVLYNAAARATPPKVKTKEAETFQQNEIQMILEKAKLEPLKWRTIIHLIAITGARRGEIAGLQWSKVDWVNNKILIDTALLYSTCRGTYTDTTKTHTARFIKLPEETMQLLREYRKWWLMERMKNRDRWEETDFLFIGDKGGHIHPDTISSHLATFGKKYGLEKCHPHKFRHSMASLLIYNHTDLVAVSKRLGHAKVSTTTDIYAHQIQEADANASECIADILLRNPQKKTG